MTDTSEDKTRTLDLVFGAERTYTAYTPALRPADFREIEGMEYEYRQVLVVTVTAAAAMEAIETYVTVTYTGPKMDSWGKILPGTTETKNVDVTRSVHFKGECVFSVRAGTEHRFRLKR